MSLFVTLNSAQLAAVQHRGAPLLVLAGAGTGKTRVITHRVASLLDDGVPPWRVLAVTFTNKAASEMRARIAELCGDDHDIKGLWVGTFHSICARILRRFGEPVGLSPNFSIYDSADQKSLMKQTMKELRISDKTYRPQLFLGYLDKLKNAGRHVSDKALFRLGVEEPVRSTALNVLKRYQRKLRAADAADFGDLLVLAVELLEQARAQPAPEPVYTPPPPPAPGQTGSLFADLPNPSRQQTAPSGRLRYRKKAPTDGSQLADQDPVVKLTRRFKQVLVDEYQDTNPVQARLVRALSGEAEVCVVGDDDQAIYGWRGADVTQILGFPERHPGSRIIRLEQNYRSTSHILECAHEIIRRNRGRHGKKLWSELGDGQPVRVLTVEDEREEARFIANDIIDYLEEGSPEDIAIFYRTHAQSRAIEEALRLAGLRYNVFGGLRFFDRKEIKDLVAYLRLLVNRASDVDFLRVVNTPPRKLGKTSIGRLSEYASARDMSLWQAVAHAQEAGIGTAARRRLEAFVTLVDRLDEGLKAHGDLGRVAGEILEHTGYRTMLAGEGTDEAQTRLENLQEFVGELEAYSEEVPGASLADYLEQVSLASDADGVDGQGTLTMMTIHSAKGLEFRRVYLTGMEEGVFPHARVLEDDKQMEEERRLAYVAVTRAKRSLTVSWARARRLYGIQQVRRPSRFIGDLPREHVALVGRAGAYSGSRPTSRTPQRGPARRQHWDADVVYDEPATPDTPAASAPDEGVSIYIGMQVQHKKFGVGEVMGWDGAGDSLKLVLRFARVGTKTIMARFCQPV